MVDIEKDTNELIGVCSDCGAVLEKPTIETGLCDECFKENIPL